MGAPTAFLRFAAQRRLTGGVVAFLLLLLAPTRLPATLTLASRGVSDYRIVLPDHPIASERYAAEELQRYVELITGARLPIVNATSTSGVGAREIILGGNSRPEDPRLEPGELGSDGFKLVTRGNRLTIAGGRPRGTLNGVYTFLEEQLGVRWFTPELETVPRTNRLVIGSLDATRVPQLEYREVFWTDLMRSGDFAARHRINGQHCNLKEKHGGPAAVYFPFVHSFDSLIPLNLYEEHPEYFPLIDGKRAKGYVQRCLSNPQVVALAIQRVREWIRDHPEASIISVSQNDTGNWCTCEPCKALDDAEGTPAASLIRFVNSVAADIERDFPKVRIDTLAYQYTRKPPKTIRPRRNVIIRLCSIECCFDHPLALCSSEQNRRFRGDIEAWQPVAPLLYIWDYTPNFAHYQQPFPNLDALQPNVQFFVEHGVTGLFEQGNYSPGGCGEMGPLRAYLLAKLLWNPKTDVQQHQREFCDAFYGKASPYVQEYLELLHEQIRGDKAHAFIYDSPNAGYLGESFITRAEVLLRSGSAAAVTPETRFRTQLASLPVWYVQIVAELVKGQKRTELLRQFLEIARKAGISHISEGQSLVEWARRLGQPIETRTP